MRKPLEHPVLHLLHAAIGGGGGKGREEEEQQQQQQKKKDRVEGGGQTDRQTDRQGVSERNGKTHGSAIIFTNTQVAHFRCNCFVRVAAVEVECKVSKQQHQANNLHVKVGNVHWLVTQTRSSARLGEMGGNVNVSKTGICVHANNIWLELGKKGEGKREAQSLLAGKSSESE